MVKVKKPGSGADEQHEQATSIDVRSGVLFVLRGPGTAVAVYNSEQWISAVVESSGSSSR